MNIYLDDDLRAVASQTAEFVDAEFGDQELDTGLIAVALLA